MATFQKSSEIDLQGCRFCSAHLEDSEKQEIDSAFKFLYNSLTNNELITNDKLPKFVCKSCFDEIVNAANIKQKVVKSQENLLQVLEQMNEKTREKTKQYPDLQVRK